MCRLPQPKQNPIAPAMRRPHRRMSALARCWEGAMGNPCVNRPPSPDTPIACLASARNHDPMGSTWCVVTMAQRPVPSAGALGCWELHGVGTEFHGGGGLTPERSPDRPRGLAVRWKHLMRREHVAVRPGGSVRLRANSVQLPRKQCRSTRPRRSRLDETFGGNVPASGAERGGFGMLGVTRCWRGVSRRRWIDPRAIARPPVWICGSMETPHAT